jgi:hypothetical protein
VTWKESGAVKVKETTVKEKHMRRGRGNRRTTERKARKTANENHGS